MEHFKLFLLLIPWLGTIASTDDCQQQNCPKNGHVLLPFINDCTRFVVCQNGLASIRSCREDFYFDSKMRACMPKTENSCKPCVVETSTQPPTQEKPSKNQIVSLIRTVLTPFNDISEKCIQNSITPVLCIPPLPDNRFIPHPDDCQLFYYCISAEIPPICRDCPDGMHFDPIERACAHPSVAKCQIPTKVSTNNLLNEAKTVRYTTTPAPKVVDTISLKCLRNSVTPIQCTAPIPRDNLLPHPDDCGLYYFCLSTDLPAICRDCPEGLHFHPLRHICESPVTASCLKNTTNLPTTTTRKPNVMIVTSVSSPRRNVSDKCRQNTKTPVMCTPELTEQSVFAHPDDCELYYHCPSTYLAPVCLDCPNGLHYNPAKHTCDVPAKAGCSIANQQNTGTQGSESQIIHVISSVPNNTSDKCRQYSSTRVHCTSRNTLIPHPDSCELYYYCMSSNLPPQCRFCPNGLHFSPVERTCHEPFTAGCIKFNQTTLTNRGSHSGRELTVETVTSVPNQDAISEKCKQQAITSVFCTSENSLLPHPYSCELYFYCITANRPAICRDCPDGLHFNAITRTCQNPTKAECQTLVQPTPSYPTYSVVTSVSVNTAHSVSQNCNKYPVTRIKCHSSGLFPHPDSCELYFKCASTGSPSICEECPKGLLFNPTLQVCDDKVGCLLWYRRDITDIDTSDTNEIDTSEKCRQYGPSQTKCKAPISQNSLLPHPEDCQLYYKCTSIDSPPICQECPNGQHFNPTKRTCDHIDRAGCQTKSAKLTELSEEESIICKRENGRFADLRPSGLDCNRYYVCDWGRVMAMSCPPLLHFNAKLKICDLPVNAGCTLSGQGGQRQNRSRQKQVQCTVGYTPAGEFLPDPGSCETFYHCDWGVPVKKQCPPGLHFSPALKVCDFPEKANCRISHLRV